MSEPLKKVVMDYSANQRYILEELKMNIWNIVNDVKSFGDYINYLEYTLITKKF